MDSAHDASLQQVGSSYMYLFRQASDFCENPFCLGEGWHTWGSCSNPGTNRFDTAEATWANAAVEGRRQYQYGCGLEQEGTAHTSQLLHMSETQPATTNYSNCKHLPLALRGLT